VVAATTLVASCSSDTRAGADAAAPAEHADPRAAVCDEVAPGVSPPYDVIQQLFTEYCVTCHAGGGTEVDLSSGVSWANLINRSAPPTERCGGILVVPGDPDSSYLYQKLASSQPCSGLQMPRTEFGNDPLPDCVVSLVRNWISAGASGTPTDAAAEE
jgi:hypothetical protein